MRQRAGRVGAVLVLTLVVGTAVILRRRPLVWSTPAGETTRIAVAPFENPQPSTGWGMGQLAESLAARLRRTPGLDATVSDGPFDEADYVLQGHVTESGDRVVIAIRLQPTAAGEFVWSATFWRRSPPDPSIADDLGRAIAEALETTRRSNSPPERKRP